MGAQVCSKLASKLAQVGLKINIQLHSNFEFVSEWILEPLGLDFGGHLGSQIESKNELKIRRVKIAKFDSRLHGSSIFDVSRGSKFDEKSMQRGLQNKISSEGPKNIEKAPNIGPSWAPSWRQNRAKDAMKTNTNTTSNLKVNFFVFRFNFGAAQRNARGH